MKARTTFLIVVAALFTAVASAQDSVPLPKGLSLGMTYIQVKVSLLKDSWHAEPTQKSDYTPFTQFPEITCGHGRDAICSAGFSRGNEWLSLIVDETKDHVVLVTGTY